MSIVSTGAAITLKRVFQVIGQAQPKRCTRNTCIGTGVCFQHLRSMYHLRVGDSPIAGKGLFAVDPKKMILLLNIMENVLMKQY